jgi:hypothetical protein
VQVKELQGKLADQQRQMATQVRQNLESSDKLRETARKVNTTESTLQKTRAENYSLKMIVDELKSKKGDQAVQKKGPKKIVEMLKFDDERGKVKEEIKEEKEEFVLKEVVASNKDNLTVAPPPAIDSIFEKENTMSQQETAVKPRKKAAMFADKVEVLDTETGAVEAASLREEPVEARKPPGRKPVGRRQGGAAATVKVAEQQVADECKQQ